MVPFFGDVLAQEGDHGSGEFVECFVAFVVRGVSVHEAPRSLDGVEMRAVAGDEVQFDPAIWLRQPALHQMGMVARSNETPRFGA